MILFIKTWWPAFVLLAVLIAVWLYGQDQRKDEREKLTAKTTIEKLETQQLENVRAIKKRTKQNEIRNNRSDTDALIDSLQKGTF